MAFVDGPVSNAALARCGDPTPPLHLAERAKGTRGGEGRALAAQTGDWARRGPLLQQTKQGARLSGLAAVVQAAAVPAISQPGPPTATLYTSHRQRRRSSPIAQLFPTRRTPENPEPIPSSPARRPPHPPTVPKLPSTLTRFSEESPPRFVPTGRPVFHAPILRIQEGRAHRRDTLTGSTTRLDSLKNKRFKKSNRENQSLQRRKKEKGRGKGTESEKYRCVGILTDGHTTETISNGAILTHPGNQRGAPTDVQLSLDTSEGWFVCFPRPAVPLVE